MLIAGLQKNSTIDFPGCLSAVLFTAGCNLRCFYCHNRALLSHPPLLSEEEVSAFLVKRAGLLDGVVFTGGEPTLQKDIAWWLNRVKKLGYKTKLDTNGTRPAVLASLLQAGLLDYVAMDYKAPFSMYPALCLAPARGAPESMERLREAGVPYELRTTAVPMLTEAILIEMAKALPPGAKWAIQLYREQPGDEAYLKGLRPYTPGEISRLVDALKPHAPGVFARC